MRPVVLIGALVAATSLVSCASEVPKPAPPATSTTPAVSATSTAPAEAHGTLAQCLREHGVPSAPGPTAGPPPGVDQATWQKAKQACATLEPGPANP